MKKQLFTLILAISASFAFSQSVPNGGFENWTITNYAVPQFYQSSSFNSVQSSGSAIAPYNAVQTTDSYHGTYAIQLTTATAVGGGSPVFAYVSNGQPSSGTTPPKGGIPYTQQATGIRFYYKSNIMAGDTALVLVQFKKAYSLIGSYLFKISSTKSTYTLFSSAFSPALPMAPDSVMFAGVSSNVFAGTSIIGNMLQLDSVSFTGVSSQPVNFNGDFELWNPTVNYNLAGWKLSDLCKQTTDAYSGSYALELITNHDPNNGGNVYMAQATTGNHNYGSGGYPFTQQNDTLVFYYKYVPASGSNDTATLSTDVKKAGAGVGGMLVNLLPAASYTMVKTPLISSSVPDSLIISIQSSKSYPVATNKIGSDLKIDNMYLMSSPLGIKIAEINNAISVQPNPSNGVFNISVQGFTAAKMEKIEIYDLTGKLVETKAYSAGTSSETFDLSKLNAGTYNVNIISNGSLVSKKVVVVH
ncbi:MAG TPA: T9SS type A sorting domain-containing protein [Bacteroidia bacterium]|jgi:hypothetical protein|nr:T9SS type A sorting domain-containing protein [Bacteroidia bacterium]